MDKVFIVYELLYNESRKQYLAAFSSNELAQKYIDKHTRTDYMRIDELDVNPNQYNIEQSENFYVVRFDDAGNTVRAEKLDSLPGYNLVETSYLNYGNGKAFELFASSLEQAIKKAKVR